VGGKTDISRPVSEGVGSCEPVDDRRRIQRTYSSLSEDQYGLKMNVARWITSRVPACTRSRELDQA
jgi:hypothetical protein